MAEFFPYTCPHCSNVRNAADIAAELPDEVLRLAAGRRNVLRRRRYGAGTGRPILSRCPGCSQEMSAVDLREHRIGCVRNELQKFGGMAIRLSPKDPDPYPNFSLLRVDETKAEFQKDSNHEVLTIDLRKIAEISVSAADRLAHIRLLGRVTWQDDAKRWRFMPTASAGRPPHVNGVQA